VTIVQQRFLCRANSEFFITHGFTSMIAPRSTYDVVVLGSGPAGQNAALEAASRDAQVLIVEQEPNVGGACVQYGTIPSKTLRETALTLTAFQRRSGDVYRISHDAELSICSLTKRLNDVVHAHQQTTRLCLERAGIQRAHGRGRFVSPNEIAIDSVGGRTTHITASTVVIATGSRPRNPPHVAVDHENILDSDSILSMTYLPRSIIVLGGGVIACEYASTFAALGVKVIMLDKAPRPLGFLDQELVDFFLQRFTENQSTFHGGVEIESIRWDGISSVVATLKTGEKFCADKAFIALGRVANLESLAIDKAGLQPSERGLLTVNEYCQTSIPHIYAVGDTIGPPALASASMEQGRRAMTHALSGIHQSGVGALPAGIYTIPEISTVGLTETQAIEKCGGALVARINYDQIARAHIMASSSGVLKLVADARGEKLLGVQIAGDGATELVHIGQMALLGQMSVDVFANATFNFPTMAEAYRLAALEIIHAREGLRPEELRVTNQDRSQLLTHAGQN
jgi:NAD(P) transhydrogenase